jgi:hypothetical protein
LRQDLFTIYNKFYYKKEEVYSNIRKYILNYKEMSQMNIIKRTLLIIISLFFLFSYSPINAISLDKLKELGFKDVEIEIRIEDKDRKELRLPLTVSWKSQNRIKTYNSVNFLEDSLITLRKKIPRKETY